MKRSFSDISRVKFTYIENINVYILVAKLPSLYVSHGIKDRKKILKPMDYITFCSNKSAITISVLFKSACREHALHILKNAGAE